MKGEKITLIQDLNSKKIQFIFDHDKLAINAIDSSKNDLLVVIKQILHSFLSKLKSVRFENEGLVNKKNERMPSLQNIVFNASNLGEGLNYHLNQKSLNNPELLSPFVATNVLGR